MRSSRRARLARFPIRFLAMGCICVTQAGLTTFHGIMRRAVRSLSASIHRLRLSREPARSGFLARGTACWPRILPAKATVPSASTGKGVGASSCPYQTTRQHVLCQQAHCHSLQACLLGQRLCSLASNGGRIQLSVPI